MKNFIFLMTLCLSLATGAAFAQSYGGGRGTESDPFLISSRTHLEELATTVNGGASCEGYHFKLTANLTGVTTIIGNAEAFFFSGIFDGDGHTIELNINTTGNYAGVFGNLRGMVKNMNVSGRIVSTLPPSSPSSYAGGICGYANNSTVSNCYNTGSISASVSSPSHSPSSYAGGICGYANNSTVSNCYNTGSISAASAEAASSHAGGICGSNGTVSNCYNTGSISSSSSSSRYSSFFYAGGICGSGGTVSNCYNTGSISAASADAAYFYSYAGGICGSGVTVSNCYNTGSISSSSDSDSYAGGICGSRGTVSNCFAANAIITATNSSQAGRIVGGGSISNCHASTAMKVNGLEKRSMNAGSKDGADSGEADFKNESWLTSVLKWDFGTVWTMGRSGWPVLKGLDEPTGNLSPERPLPEVVLYPNPATHDVYIRSDRPVSKVEIYNSAGLCVWRTGNFTDKADVSGLESGVYAVRIYMTPEPQTKLLIIRK